MSKNTLLQVLLAGFVSLPLICAPQSVFAQHGGGGHGGGGGGGGFHRRWWGRLRWRGLPWGR